MTIHSPATLSRRQFLHQMAATYVVAAASRTCIAADPANVSFGFTFYGMRSLSLSQAIKVCAEAGYDSVELACMVDWPAAPEKLSPTDRTELRRQLTDSRLSVAGLMEDVSPLAEGAAHTANLDSLKRACVLARDLSPEKTPVIETVLGGKPADWERVRGTIVKGLHDWAKVAETERGVIALKPHVSGALHTPEDAAWLMDQLKTPNLKLAYDYSHFEVRGLPLKTSLEAMLPQTAFIHVKDTAGTADKFQFLLPGDGRTDYAAYFQQLKAANYHGPLVVEVSGQIHSRPGYDPVAAAKHCYSKLAPLMAQAGLRS